MSWFETKVPPVIWWLWASVVVLIVDVTFGDEMLAGWGRIVAVLFLVAGIGVAAAALSGFGRAKTSVDPHDPSKTTSLVTDGVYKLSRNPMYLGLALLIVGWGFWRGTLLGVVVGLIPFVVAITRFQIIPEERVLAERYGRAYADFSASTRRWI